jgi:hypothetical protein
MRFAAFIAPILAASAVWMLVWTWPGVMAEREIARHIGARALAGDAVVVTPAGSLDRLREYMGRGLSAASAADDASARAAGFARVWIVGELGRSGAPAVSQGAVVRSRETVAGTSVVLVEAPSAPASPGSPIGARMKVVRAWMRRSGEPRSAARSCAPDGEKLRCGPSPWQWVGPTQMEVGGVRRSCIWAHPRAGHVLSILVSRAAGDALTSLLSDTARTRTDAPAIEIRVEAVPLDGSAVDAPPALATKLDRYTHARTEREILRPATRAATASQFLYVEIETSDDGAAHLCLASTKAPR